MTRKINEEINGEVLLILAGPILLKNVTTAYDISEKIKLMWRRNGE
jgi:hypothetical protein